MKKTLLSLLVIFSAFELFAQIEKGNILVSGFGNYIKTATENGVTTNKNAANVKSMNAGASIGYFLTNRFIAGAGLEYVHEKETRYNEMYFNDFLQAEEMNIKSNGFLPYLYLGYYLPIVPKLYFNTNLKLSLGQIKSDYQTTYAGKEEISTTTDLINSPYTYNRSSVGDVKMDYFGAQITPELSYNFAKHFSAYLGLGGISYSMLDWETNNSNWLVSFNPNNWSVGIKIHL